MKHFSAKLILAALFAGAAVTASAANPFSDVKTDDWSYQAVEKLSAEGVVEGYPDGTFKGDKPITRYEMSQIVAKLMAKQDTLSAEQRQTVGKLSGEYAEELKNLGVRVSELEKKVSDTQVVLEMRLHYAPVYSDVYKGEKEDAFGARLRINTISRINDRFYVYGQAQTLFDFNGNYKDPWYYTTPKGDKSYGQNDGEVSMRRLFSTFHFGKGDGNNKGMGPSKDIIAIGQFGVKVGVTGYTYDGSIKGVMAQFGDFHEGGHFTVAYGRGTDFNYNYTSPMMRGVPGFQHIVAEDVGKKITAATGSEALGKTLQATISNTTNPAELAGNVQNWANTYIQDETTRKAIMAQLSPSLAKVGNYAANIPDWGPDAGNFYPLYPEVYMGEGDDMDVPVAYMSYIYRKPEKYELHFYGMRAVGPVFHIAKAYGTALSFNLGPKWNVHGEFVKNLVKLPLNNERPHSFNYGLQFGTANVLKEKSYSFGVDYVYSQAGTYFGGADNEIVDQYQGHVYRDWHGRGRMPAYIADYIDDVMDGTYDPNTNYGGAKFFLAKAQYVPKKGLILEANYGFHARDMGDRKMDNMFRFTATMFYK